MDWETFDRQLQRVHVLSVLSFLANMALMGLLMGLMGVFLGIASFVVGQKIGSMGGPSEHVPRATRTFSWLAAIAPRRVWQEETGDALEVIAAMEKAGCSAFKIRLKIWSTIFWVLLNGMRELVAALAGRKSPQK